MMKELESLEQPPLQSDPTCLAASAAKQRPKQDSLKGRGVLIELCTEPDSNLGVVGKRLNVKVTRCTKEVNNLEYESTTSRHEGVHPSTPRHWFVGKPSLWPVEPMAVPQCAPLWGRVQGEVGQVRRLVLIFCELARCVVEQEAMFILNGLGMRWVGSRLHCASSSETLA